MKAVQFTVALENYAVGDIGAFDDKIADKLIEGQYGELVAIEATKLEEPPNPEEIPKTEEPANTADPLKDKK